MRLLDRMTITTISTDRLYELVNAERDSLIRVLYTIYSVMGLSPDVEQVPIEIVAERLRAFTGEEISNALFASIKNDWELTQELKTEKKE
jgi:hypothetical protein